jgi:DNA-directed RNA polymerase subunit M/transcription elongation factor TFIIS
MKFCQECDNLLVTKIADIDSENNMDKLISYQCINCGYKEELKITNKDTHKCVYFNKKGAVSNKIDATVVSHLSLDPTLPRVNNLQCPNTICPSVKGNKISDIVYIEIDADTMTYMYKCNNCQQTWKNK